MHFQSKTIFSFNLLLIGFDFAALYIFVSSDTFSLLPIMKLHIASYLHVCIASYLASHQIMWNMAKVTQFLEGPTPTL